MRYALLFFTLSLSAHDLYLMPQRFFAQPGEKLLVTIHNGDSFPMGTEGVDPARIRDARNASDFRYIGRATHGFAEFAAPGSHWVSLRTEPREFTLEAAKFEPYLKEEGLSAAMKVRAELGEAGKPGRERYSKHAKTLVTVGAADEGWKKPAGLLIEFLPEKDPAAVKPGEDLPVRVVFKQQAAADLQVEACWANGKDKGCKIAGRTGADGRLSVTLPQAGMYRLHAVHMERVSGSVDWESWWASMTFAIK